MASPFMRDGSTLPLTVKNTGFLLDRLGQDCHPLQFLRELTQNAIEAIGRTLAQGEIAWDMDWVEFDLTGQYKLSIIDTGDGMTGEEMVKYINQLSSSLSTQDLSGNYGVGAKIAAATRNHAGLIYLSWKSGAGSMIHLWRDPRTGQYGLRQFGRPDGTFGHFTDVEDAVKPEQIDQHGTKIVLVGQAETDNTMQAPEGSPAPSRWVARYLNTRYFSVPANITIRCREGWEYPRSDKDRNLLRKVTGQGPYLTEHAEVSGQVPLENAIAHWWILKDESALGQNSGFLESAGHIAALYKNELYEMATARSGMAKLQQFGVWTGHRRVVIYVEPKVANDIRLTTNTARTVLLMNNLPLPWAEWATEFRENMPVEIEELIERIVAGAQASDQSDAIRERLKEHLDLYKVSRYRLTPTGDLLVDEVARTRGGQAQDRDRSAGSGSGRAGTPGGTAGGAYSVFQKKDGAPGRQVRPDVFPEIHWVTVENGQRQLGDLEDRAARFLMDQNRLLINGDFRVFTDMVDRWVKEYKDRPGAADVIRDTVRAWFAQALVEAVIGIQALKDSKEWTIDDVKKALSEEALTAAIVARYHVNNSVKRELGTKLGKLQAVVPSSRP
jgi:hypothetical protein